VAKQISTEGRLFRKLDRIEELLENLLALQGCIAGAHKEQLAKWIGIDKNRVTGISTAIKAGERDTKGKG